MKIVHVCLCGPVTDGWNYQDNMLTKYHKKLGHDVTIITSQWIWGEKGRLEKYKKSNYYDINGVKVIRLPIRGRDKFEKKFKRYNFLIESINNEEPDILFIHGVQFLDIQIIVKYLKNHKNVKVFVDNHSDFSNSATNWLSKNILHKILWKNMANKIEPFTTKFYGVIPARVDFLINIYNLPQKKVELLVMGGDDDKVIENQDKTKIKELRDKYSIKQTDFLIVTGGKIDEAKQETLLLMKAIKKFNSSDVKLLVFGSVVDSLKREFNELCDNKQIIYAGWIQAEQTYRYFAAADLVVFPGRHSVFWEQVAAQGKPMICKYWEGTTHIDVGGNVFFIKQNSIDELYVKIKEILNNKNIYFSMKNKAETLAMNKFSYSTIAKKSIVCCID